MASICCDKLEGAVCDYGETCECKAEFRWVWKPVGLSLRKELVKEYTGHFEECSRPYEIDEKSGEIVDKASKEPLTTCPFCGETIR